MVLREPIAQQSAECLPFNFLVQRANAIDHLGITAGSSHGLTVSSVGGYCTSQLPVLHAYTMTE